MYPCRDVPMQTYFEFKKNPLRARCQHARAIRFTELQEQREIDTSTRGLSDLLVGIMTEPLDDDDGC